MNFKRIFFVFLWISPNYEKMCKTNLPKYLAIIILFISTQEVIAQKKVVVKHGVEYLEDADDDGGLNSIVIPAKSAKAKPEKAKKLSKEALAIKKLNKVTQKRKKLRFRNKRKKDASKCVKDVKKQKCDSTVKKKN